jgi:hypothetical protein
MKEMRVLDKEKIVIFACKTIYDEVNLAREKCSCTYPVHFLEDNLHNFPDKLREAVQKELDKLDGADRVLMAFGLCGNAMIGLKSHSFQLILPRVDDCISMMLGSMKRRAEISKEGQSIYLTRGWLENPSNIWAEYEYTVKKYGKKTAEYIIKTMYGKYENLTLIDTKAYELEMIEERTSRIADAFHLVPREVEGTVIMLEQLFTGPWEEEQFIVVPPHSAVTEEKADLHLLEMCSKKT